MAIMNWKHDARLRYSNQLIYSIPIQLSSRRSELQLIALGLAIEESSEID